MFALVAFGDSQLTQRSRHCPGVFLIRNSTYTHEFLDVWYGSLDSPFVYHPHWEQAALVCMLTYSRWSMGLGVPPVEACELGMDPFGTCTPEATTSPYSSTPKIDMQKAARVLKGLHSHVMFHPQRWMNSYPAALSNYIRDWDDKPAHTRYTPGDFIVSFSGCGWILGSSKCSEMYEEAYDQSEATNAHK
jgi:galactosyl transferase GMA12/MNN10 family